MVCINRLTAEEWLRLLREQPLVNWQVQYCVKCDGVEISTSLLECEGCHTPMTPLGESFWRKVSNKLRRSYQKDHGLFARIKGEYPNWPFPELNEPLAWVTTEWRRARRLRGKPLEVEKRLFVVSWIRKLSEPYFSIEVDDLLDMTQQDMNAEGPILTVAKLSGGLTAGMPTHTVRIVKHPPHMTVTLASSVLFDEEPEFFGFLGRRKWKHFSEEQLRELGKQFRETFSKRFGDVPTGDRREIDRTIRWARRLAPEPTVRLAGSKPRDRVPKHKK